MNDPYRLERFIAAQDRFDSYLQALEEIRAGYKQTHWIWWVFPQYSGLGFSATSRKYSISSLEEAKAYLRHFLLGPRLRDATAAMNEHAGESAESILHSDDVKFRSSMTLFMRADPGETLFPRALEIFFDAEPDVNTDRLLRHSY